MRFALLSLLLLVGCDAVQPATPRLRYLPDQEQPIPVADLPLPMRVENWIGTNDRGDRGGSCFWASIWNCVRASGQTEWEPILASARSKGFEGPEHLDSMCDKLNSIQMPWIATDDGDPAVLEYASRTRRWCAIGYYPGHAVNFVGFHTLTRDHITQIFGSEMLLRNTPADLMQLQGTEVAILLDNNFTDQYIEVKPKQRFLTSWQRAYHGHAVCPLLNPVLPKAFFRTTRIQ